MPKKKETSQHVPSEPQPATWPSHHFLAAAVMTSFAFNVFGVVASARKSWQSAAVTARTMVHQMGIPKNGWFIV